MFIGGHARFSTDLDFTALEEHDHEDVILAMMGAFEQKFRIKTEILNPFRGLNVDDSKFDSMYFNEMAPIFGVAVGLATRKAEK